MPAIVKSGRDYITSNLKANLQSDITRFILADVPHSDPLSPVDDNETMPTSEQIKYDETITRKSKMNDDAVVFSQIIMSDVGDFDFNWIGLATDDDTLIAVAYVERQHKRAYINEQIGNTLTRNMVLQFANAADALGVNVSPETWQFDFTDLIGQEIAANLKAQIVDVQELSIKLGALNIFTTHDEVKLPAVKDGEYFSAKVHTDVDLTTGDCAYTAPDGEQINHNGVKVPRVRFVRKNQEFRFIRVNGEWFV